MNIVPRWDIYGRLKLASFDIPARDNIHWYQCNNPIIYTGFHRFGHEIISTAILSLLLIQVGQLLVAGECMGT